MKRSKRHNWLIPLLMFTSGLLLVVFLVSWLMTQYHQAEKRLEKDVRADLRKTSDQMVDSLMIHFFSVSEKQQTNPTATIAIPENNGKRTFAKSTTEINIVVQEGASKDDSVRKELVRKIPPATAGFVRIETDNNRKTVITETTEEVIDDSVLNQLFAQGAGAMARKLSTYQKTSNILTLTNQQLDTTQCRKLLKKNWQNKSLKYHLLFHPKSKDKSVFYSGNPLYGSTFGVKLENEKSVLFSAILPEFLFALFLVLMTTGSFLLVYRSYLRQLQINVLRTDFVNNISHELKTPVSTVRVALEALQHYRKNDPQVRDEYLRLMSLEIDRLDRLIHQVLQHGRLDASENLLQLEPVDMNALIADVVERFRLKVEENGAVIHLILPDKPVTMQADAEHLSAVVGNLMENALLYAGKHPEITITLKRNGKQIVLEVQDNGPGIPQEFHGQLFQPFFRVPTGNTHNVKGYGLGLSYCKQIVEQHGGTISVQNVSPTEGCLFRIVFMN